ARAAQDEADEARRGLMNLALHNIRTPLTVAMGSMTTLQRHLDRLTPDDRESLFASIARAHQRVLEVAEGALLESVARDVGPGEATEIAVADLLDDVVGELDDAA